MKVCKRCHIEKDTTFFSKKNSSKDGLNNWCKNCNKEYLKQYYIDNKETLDNRSKQYYIDNIDEITQYSKNYKKEHREHYQDYFTSYYLNSKENLSNYKKNWYLNNKEEHLKKNKINRLENREEYLNYLKNWRDNNKDSNKEYIKNWFLENPEKRKEYFKNLRNNKPHIVAWRNSLHSTLRRIGTEKNKSTIELLGYSAYDLRTHIESLFQEGMTWNNWGEWHIDHIHPVSKFNSETPINIVNSLDNLQPLWAKDNLSKNNKII